MPIPPILNWGITSYPHYQRGNVAYVPLAPDVVDVGNFEYSQVICTMNFGQTICIATAGEDCILHVVYIDAFTGNEIAARFDVQLPTRFSVSGNTNRVVGIKQLSTYTFRVLIGSSWDAMWAPSVKAYYKFLRVDVNYSNISFESEYRFPEPTAYSYIWAVDERFEPNSRVGDKIFGYQHVHRVNDTRPGYSSWGEYVSGIVADMGSGTFGAFTQMTPAMSGALSMVVGHNGDEGFLIRIFQATSGWTKGWPNQSYYFYTGVTANLLEWTSLDISTAAARNLLVEDTDFDPNLFITYDQYWPSVYEGPKDSTFMQGGQVGSFYLPVTAGIGLQYELGDHQEYLPTSHTYSVSVSSGYPLAVEDPVYATPPFDVSYTMYLELGYALTYKSGIIRASDSKVFFWDRLSNATIELSHTGLEIKTIFYKKETWSGLILCWAKDTSNNSYGIAKFTDYGAFIRFVPIAATFYTAALGYRAYIANGWIVVADYCYYIGGGNHTNVVQMIIEQN